ncbi:unnamed protein product [Closterium sp. Yama58-4]|nr:unnamed protein product [Closterium sp. Yama58-4]
MNHNFALHCMAFMLERSLLPPSELFPLSDFISQDLRPPRSANMSTYTQGAQQSLTFSSQASEVFQRNLEANARCIFHEVMA